MACHMCSRNPHCHQSFNGIHNCDAHHYSDVPPVPDDTEDEPEAPTLSLGNRILWLTEARAASGIVKWIGRLPSVSTGWTAGIEFSEFHKAWEAEYEKKADYHNLLALDDVDLVPNMEKFECPVCFLDVDAGEGTTLQECLHSFCKECLAGAIQFSETAVVKCPFRNDE